MLEVIDEIRFWLKHNKLRVALGMALTLPDICSKVEFKDAKEMKYKYIKWCELYLNNEGFVTTGSDKVIDPKVCYKLRCAYLHSGNAELNQRKKDDFPFFELRISSKEDTRIYVGRKHYGSKERSLFVWWTDRRSQKSIRRDKIRQGKVKPMIPDELRDETDLKFTVALLELLYSGILGESKNLIDLITAKNI